MRTLSYPRTDDLTSHGMDVLRILRAQEVDLDACIRLAAAVVDQAIKDACGVNTGELPAFERELYAREARAWLEAQQMRSLFEHAGMSRGDWRELVPVIQQRHRNGSNRRRQA